jgi:hypothetical protein
MAQLALFLSSDDAAAYITGAARRLVGGDIGPGFDRVSRRSKVVDGDALAGGPRDQRDVQTARCSRRGLIGARGGGLSFGLVSRRPRLASSPGGVAPIPAVRAASSIGGTPASAVGATSWRIDAPALIPVVRWGARAQGGALIPVVRWRARAPLVASLTGGGATRVLGLIGRRSLGERKGVGQCGSNRQPHVALCLHLILLLLPSSAMRPLFHPWGLPTASAMDEQALACGTEGSNRSATTREMMVRRCAG